MPCTAWTFCACAGSSWANSAKSCSSCCLVGAAAALGCLLLLLLLVLLAQPASHAVADPGSDADHGQRPQRHGARDEVDGPADAERGQEA